MKPMDQGAVLNGSIEMPNPNPRPQIDDGEEMPVLPNSARRAVGAARDLSAQETAGPDSEDLG